MVQRRAARFVLNRWGYKDSVTDMLNNLNWSSLADRRKYSRLSMFYKIHKKLVQISFNNLLLHTPDSSQSNNVNYHIPRSSTNPYKYSFLPRTITEWNSLPNSVVNKLSLNSLKVALSQN